MALVRPLTPPSSQPGSLGAVSRASPCLQPHSDPPGPVPHLLGSAFSAPPPHGCSGHQGGEGRAFGFGGGEGFCLPSPGLPIHSGLRLSLRSGEDMAFSQAGSPWTGLLVAPSMSRRSALQEPELWASAVSTRVVPQWGAASPCALGRVCAMPGCGGVGGLPLPCGSWGGGHHACPPLPASVGSLPAQPGPCGGARVWWCFLESDIG